MLIMLIILKQKCNFLILFFLITFSSQLKIEKSKKEDVFLSLEKGFNCKNNIKKNIFKEIIPQNEKEIFKSEIPFLLYITSTWCDYCCQETKILLKVQNFIIKSKNNSINKIKIYQIQSNEYNNIIKKYKVFLTKIPSLYLVKNNKEIIQYSSYFKKNDILNFISKNILSIQELKSIGETDSFMNNNKAKVKLIGLFVGEKEYFDEYSQFIKYSKEINYRKDLEIRICFDKKIAFYLKQKYNNINMIDKKRYDNIYYLDISSKRKYLKDFIYYNTFSPVEEISNNNKNIIMQLKTPIALFFIDTTYNLNNYHNALSYLEKLSFDYDLKYIFMFMDGGAKTQIKEKLGLGNDFPSLIIHHFDKKQGIKFPMKEQKFLDKNIRHFLNNNLVINNDNKEEIKEIVKNNEILSKLKKIKILLKNDYESILFNKENIEESLLFIIDEYSFDKKEIILANKIKTIMDIIDDYGINFYLNIFWISKHDLFKYKNDIHLEISDFKIKSIKYLLNSKIIIITSNCNKKDFFIKNMI